MAILVLIKNALKIFSHQLLCLNQVVGLNISPLDKLSEHFKNINESHNLLFMAHLSKTLEDELTSKGFIELKNPSNVQTDRIQIFSNDVVQVDVDEVLVIVCILRKCLQFLEK